MEARKRKNAKRSSKVSLTTNSVEISDEEDEDGGEFIGPVLAPLHVRVKPLDETVVQRNRLTTEEIKSIKKFCNYEHGTPSKVEQFIEKAFLNMNGPLKKVIVTFV